MEKEIKIEYMLIKNGIITNSTKLTLEEIEQMSPNDFYYELLEEDEIVVKREFTGLYDKNKKELYLGDIVKEPYYIDEINGFLLLEIIYCNGEYLGKVLNRDGFGFQRLTMYKELIGNKYEKK